MQAVGIGPPVLNLKSPTPGRAQGYPVRDGFQAQLQERIMSRSWSRGGSSAAAANRANLRKQLSRARPTASPSPLRLSRERSAGRSNLVDSSSQSWKADLRSRALRMAQGNPDSAQVAAVAAPTSHIQMKPALKRLIEFLQQQPGQSLKVPQEHMPEVKAFLLQAGLPEGQVESLLNSPRFQEQGLTIPGVQAAWQEACQNSLQQTLTDRLTQGTSQSAAASAANSVSNLEMSPALRGLVDFLNQQPGQALKVPAERLPEVEAFLLHSGLPVEQVENLLSSPRFQEYGLTAQDLKAAWQKALHSSIQQAQAAFGSSGSLQDLTSQPDYQRLWQNLTLPPQALADLRLQLLQLGVPPEALGNLNEQNFPQGIPLSQVWQLIQQVPKSPAAASASPDPAKGNMALNSPLLLNGEKDLEKWRQLLMQAGMDPELAQTLTSGLSPSNREELRTGLVRLAPPPAPPQELENSKPLYLPESVRLRQVPWLQQADVGLGRDGGTGGWERNLEFSPQAHEADLAWSADLKNFLTFLNENGPLPAGQPGQSAITGAAAPAVNTYLTPQAREALWSQIQSGVMGNLRPGENQVTLTLDPPDLGKLHLTLNLKGELVQVTATATNPAVAETATAQVQQLAQALNQQGLTLVQFQFHHQDETQGQPHLAFSQSFAEQRQTGKKEPDKFDRPPTPRRRWAGGIDCFA